MLTQRKATAVRPMARFEKLVVTETADEVLLYDTDKHHIHHLNATTAAVWRLCDGKHTIVDLAREAGAELGAKMDEATVRLALTKLDDAGLLKQPLIDELRMSRMSRRTFMQRAGIAGAIAVPAIISTTSAVGASWSKPTCGEPCSVAEQRDCVKGVGCDTCFDGTCITDVQLCTIANQGYPSVPCQGNSCRDSLEDGDFEIPEGSDNYNCSGGGQVPGLPKNCCTGNNTSNTASFAVTTRYPDGSLFSGAAYTLTGPGGPFNETDSNGDGITTFGGLATGSYTLTLTNPPVGYTASSQNPTLSTGINTTTVFLEEVAGLMANRSANGELQASELEALSPVLSLTPDSAKPGDTVIATVSGFAEGELITVSFQGTKLGSANNGGEVKIYLTSDLEVGTHTVVAEGATSGLSATADLKVEGKAEENKIELNPAMSVAPASGEAGTQATVSVSGFDPATSISISFAGVFLGDVANDSSSAFTVPSVDAGTYAFEATQVSNGASASAGFEVLPPPFVPNPSVSVSATTLNPGDILQVWVSGYHPDETVAVTLNGAWAADTWNGGEASIQMGKPGDYEVGATGGTTRAYNSVWVSVVTPAQPNQPELQQAPAAQQEQTLLATQEATQVPTQEATQVPTQEATQVPTQEATQVPTQVSTEVPGTEEPETSGT